MQVQVYKCEKTGKLFETQDAYETHLKRLRSQASKEKRQNSAAKELKIQANRPSLEATSIAHLRELLLECYPKVQVAARKVGDYSVRQTRVQLLDVQLSVKLSSMAERGYREAPFIGQDTPSGMVYHGKLNLTYDREPSFFYRLLRDYFPFIRTGNGQGKTTNEGYVQTYDIKILLDDLPEVYAKYQAYQALCAEERQYQERVSQKLSELCAADPGLNASKATQEALQAEVNDLLAQIQTLRENDATIVKTLKMRASSQFSFDADAKFALKDELFIANQLPF